MSDANNKTESALSVDEETASIEREPKSVDDVARDAERPAGKELPKATVKLSKILDRQNAAIRATTTYGVGPSATKGGCPGCGFAGSTLLGKLNGCDVLQCSCCHTAYIAGGAGAPIAKSENGLTLSRLGNSSNLCEDLAAVFAALNPGDSITIDEPLRLNEGIQSIEAGHWLDDGRVAFLSIGGIDLAAQAVGFLPVNPDVRPLKLIKPEKAK